MRLVIVESPYKGDVARNIEYARDAMRDAISRGEAPFASHILLAASGVLDDEQPGERAIGMQIGWEWAKLADCVVVYDDLGISEGMKRGIEFGLRWGLTVEYRHLPKWIGSRS